MKLKKRTILTIVFIFTVISHESRLSAKSTIPVETESAAESIGLTVFLPVESQPGSYVLEGNLVVIPVGKTVTIPKKATQINLPAQTIVTVLRGASTENPVTETYVTTKSVEIATPTHEALKEVEKRVAPIGRSSGLPVLETSGLARDNATDAN